ncbi:HAMP domain-containing sensor histidine kinase [Microbacterium invictum]|uniref:histidine kinase n=1 Tax=Microbacterium invictum TaxID=515415 RepID=A0ABZ0VC39_9MICO|nr:HAMP domain-containing sensor histidine kinase [Microbacterium invictum]WQB71188.1 HAMP domain-containing sensor histidine kinase [Microbacterium invictum]
MTRRRWTLRRTLVVGTACVVAGGFLVTGATTVVALQSFVYERLDAQVLEGLEFAAGRSGEGAPDDARTPDPTDERPTPAPRAGTLQVVLDGDGDVVSSQYVTPTGAELVLTDEQIDTVEAADLAPRTPTTITLADLGAFRVAADTGGGTTVVAGLPLEEVTATTSALTVILVAVAGGSLVVVVIALSVFVRRTLRPLDRVADVAQRVAARPLSEGAVDIPDRVAPADVDAHAEVGRVGASLNTLLGHIEAALAARHRSEERLRRFIADASHELRTPLASIRGYAQLSLGEAAPMTPTQERSFDRIAAESERMASLVDDLLLLARLDAGQPLRREPVSLALLAIDAVSDAHAADPTRDWRLDISEEQIEVVGDENRLRQVILNLLRNARTHTPQGTIVTTRLARDGDVAVLEVEDDGPGIDPAIREVLFERFVRGDSSRNRDAGSTGLGLSIAQAIVGAHGGSIGVRSAPGRTVFSVRLPL